jgi:hypothetical protein
MENTTIKTPGFYFPQAGVIGFKASESLKVNADWVLSLDEIMGIAVCNTMCGDWDSDFLIFFRKNGEPIYLGFGSYAGFEEELEQFDKFWGLLVERFQVPTAYQAFLKEDSTVLIYPKGYEQEAVYCKWYQSWAAFWFETKKLFSNKHCASGWLRPEISAVFQLPVSSQAG